MDECAADDADGCCRGDGGPVVEIGWLFVEFVSEGEVCSVVGLFISDFVESGAYVGFDLDEVCFSGS